MKVTTKILSLFIATYIFSISCFMGIVNAAWDLKDYVTYVGYTNQAINIAWTPTAYAETYEVRLLYTEKNIYIDKGSTTEPTIAISLPKVGHYVVEVRSVNSVGAGPWCQSSNPVNGTVNNVGRAWWLYGYLAPAGPITIGLIKIDDKGEM